MAIKRLTDEERFMRSIKSVGLGCWIWQKGRDADGYGIFRIGSRKNGTRFNARAHRWSYEHFVGPIPAAFTIDHLCKNPGCVRPYHLEPVTGVENTKRNYRAIATHCKRGHLLSGHNLIVREPSTSRPWRQRACRICSNAAIYRHGKKTKWAAQKQWRLRQKERLQSA